MAKDAIYGRQLCFATWRSARVLNTSCRALQVWLGEQKSDSLLYQIRATLELFWMQQDQISRLDVFKMAPVNGDVKWRCVIVCVILSVLLFERSVCVYTYDRKDLLHILQTVNCEYRPKLLYFSDDLSRDNTQTHTKGRAFQRDSTRRRSRKRGRCVGVLRRFRRRSYLRAPLLATVLTNARSLKNGGGDSSVVRAPDS